MGQEIGCSGFVTLVINVLDFGSSLIKNFIVKTVFQVIV